MDTLDVEVTKEIIPLKKDKKNSLIDLYRSDIQKSGIKLPLNPDQTNPIHFCTMFTCSSFACPEGCQNSCPPGCPTGCMNGCHTGTQQS